MFENNWINMAVGAVGGIVAGFAVADVINRRRKQKIQDELLNLHARVAVVEEQERRNREK